MSKMTQVDFSPKELVSYSKETQTPTEALSHTDQKAGKRTQTFPSHSLSTSVMKIVSKKYVSVFVLDEEDEEITAPPPAEDTQEENVDQSEQEVEGKTRSLTY